MKLDRNIEENEGRGKYAILKLRMLALCSTSNPFLDGIGPRLEAALYLLESNGILDWGTQGTESEFFLIRLKDRNAQAALRAYADKAREEDTGYAAEVDEMASRSGPDSPWCKQPD